MKTYRKTDSNKKKKPKIDKNIEKDIGYKKQPHREISNPIVYDRLSPGWSFKRILKEPDWIFTPEELVVMEDECINSRCIISHLASFETMTWGEIKQQTRDDNESCSHFISDISRLCKKARQRLRELGIYENIFSLRLNNKKRIYGILESNILEILWYANDHEVYPMSK